MTSSSEGSSLAVLGAGAVGSATAGLLAGSGIDAVLVGRGAHFAAIADTGLELQCGTRVQRVHPRCVPAGGGDAAPDFLLSAVKAHDLGRALAENPRLCGPQTVLVTLVNGVPWWYPRSQPGWRGDTALHSVDPGGAIAALFPPQRTLGAVVRFTAELPARGAVKVNADPLLVLGAPQAEAVPARDRLLGVLQGDLLDCQTADDIRAAVWLKLWGNAAFNPITALTGQMLDAAAGADDPCGDLRAVMGEVESVMRALGVTPPVTVEERIATLTRMGPHPTSMLLDIAQGRTPELGAIVDAVIELGARLGLDCPRLSLLAWLVRQKQNRVTVT